MVVFKQLISSALAITSISGISTGVFFTAKHTIFDTISSPPRKSVTAKSSNIKKTVAEANYKYYVVNAIDLSNHTFEDLEDYKCSSTKDGASSNLFDCVLLKLATKTDRFDNKYLDDKNTEFSSGEKIFTDTKYLLKILSTTTTTNNSPFYLQNTKQKNIFATLTTEFSYSTSAKGLESDIVVGKATKIQNDKIPESTKATYNCDTKEKCKAFEIKGTPTEDTLINYNYSTISSSDLFDYGGPVFTVVKFSESKDINFWKSKIIKAKDNGDKDFIFTPLYLMLGTIDNYTQQKTNLFVVK